MSNASNVVEMSPNAGSNAYDMERVRKDFPALHQDVYGKPLVYLDNGASALKPQAVIDTMTEVMSTYYANVHRGVHRLSQLSTDAYEEARRKVATFINAATDDEIVFVRGATEAINLVAATHGRTHLSKGDEVIISHMEHHANIVPWQMLRDEMGIVLKVVPIDDEGHFLMDAYEEMLSPRTKLVAVTHISNALGTITPMAEIIRLAHEAGALVLVDGCQAVPHMKVDVQALDADFYVFSGHKLYGPTGIGVLYGKLDLLNAMPPYQTGGDMIRSVTLEKTEFAVAPHRFEAGTPAIVETIGLGAAIDYITALGLDNIAAHEQALLEYATAQLLAVPGLHIHGTAKEKASIISFVMDAAHSHDVGTIVDRAGVAVRAGHHCAQPVMDRFGVTATARASFGIYNTKDEVDLLVEALNAVQEIFG
jgi:cysteine desulfurase/selenocysteine lyase